MRDNITIARIYFDYGQSVKEQSFFKRIWNNSLRNLLLKKAKEENIKQANLFIAKSGYLNFEAIKNNFSETPSFKNPICVELIDSDEHIEAFLTVNRELLESSTIIIVNPNSQVVNVKRDK